MEGRRFLVLPSFLSHILGKENKEERRHMFHNRDPIRILLAHCVPAFR